MQKEKGGASVKKQKRAHLTNIRCQGRVKNGKMTGAVGKLAK
jgi:hypothetical protein